MPASPICIDASFLVRLLLSPDPGFQQVELWEKWHREGRKIIAPTLIFYEIANALHRYFVHNELSQNEVFELLSIALEFDIALYGDNELHKRAVEMAQEFNLPATYDAHYLALAERFGAEFWTADKKLANSLRGKMPRIHLLQDS